MSTKTAPPPAPTTTAADMGAPGLATTPRHVAIIMDGNGRWARERDKLRTEGHRAGTRNVMRVLRCLGDRGVRCVTLFAFSTENWARPRGEVETIFELLAESLRNETQTLHAEGVRVKHLGRADRLSPALADEIRRSVELTRHNNGLTLGVAFDYGGRSELVDAVRGIISDGLDPDDVTDEAIARRLYTRGMPDPDLIIRTAGEMRLSNFLLWQAAYAEYYSTEVLWPDFDEAEAVKALEAYARRRRRYGQVDDP